MEYVTTNEGSKTTNKSLDVDQSFVNASIISNSDTNFAPVSESHEKSSESKIAKKHEMSTISSNSVTEKSQYSNCKVCKIKIPFKHINIHMKKHRKPLSYGIDRSKNKIDQIPDKSQSKKPSNSNQPEESSGTQNDMAELIEGSTKTIQKSKKSEKKTKKIELIKCSICPQSFHPGIILNQHMNLCRKYSSSIENCDEKFSCKLCQFKNPIRSEILKHIKKKHPKAADLDNPEENSKIDENVDEEAIEISEFQNPVTSEILEHSKMKHLKAADLDEPLENSKTVEHVEINPKEANLCESKEKLNVDEHLEKNPLRCENLKNITKKHLKAADLDETMENSKIDKNAEKKCPHCEEKIPKDHSNEDIKKCKQALKYIHDLLCLQCNIEFTVWPQPILIKVSGW